MAQAGAQASRQPSVLIVGAGCVGQVFGRHLTLGGARVTFLVRPKYRRDAERGFDLYPLNRWRRGEPPVRLADCEVISEISEVASRRFDQVYLTFSSAALGSAQLPELLSAIGDATLVSLQPDTEDHVLIEQAWGTRERLVCGGIAFLAFSAPLPEQTGFPRPGTAYWLPPFARCPFSGSKQRCAEVVLALRRGGLRASVWPDVPRAMAFPNAIGMAYLTALEAAHWSVSALRQGELQKPSERAVREAIAIVQRRVGRGAWGLGFLAHAWLAALLLRIGARVTPFPLMPYLKRHFTKVAAQTHLIIARLIAYGNAAGLPTDALEQVLAAALRASNP